MVRTQVYLTEEERKGLNILSEVTGKKTAALIREAVDLLISLTGKSRRDALLDRAAGMWRNRQDLPDFQANRQSWDRS
jgi:geranylgeranyl pyrophosphate synthase